MTQAVWWLFYTLAAVWAQSFFPGVDFLAPGLIVCLQKDTKAKAFWLGLCWVIIQEGASSLSFGYALAQYAVLLACYAVGRWLFEGRNFVFICLLGVLLAAAHYTLTVTLARFQEYLFDPNPVLVEAGWQALFFPLAWLAASELYPRPPQDEQQAV